MSYTRPQITSVHFPEFRKALPSMAGKTVVITGTTSGTGKAAATVVGELGARVLLLNRASSRSQASLADLKAAVPDGEFHAVECDLQSFASVEAAAKQVHALCPDGVHVLCNNAGVMALGDQATPDGFDVQMQTNHLSHFLLTRELMPLLEKAAESSGEARIVNHSSVARMAPSKELIAEFLEKRGGDLGGDGSSFQNALFRGPRWLRYNQSKLANCAFTAALHHRLQAKGSKVKALVAHPGLANTSLQQTSVKEGGMGNLLTGMMMRFSQSIEDGAMGITSCICLQDASSGQFYGPGSGATAMSGKAEPFALESYYDNAETRELLWDKSCQAIGRSFEL
ncbi:MAG: NAD(P)-dependent dehydrogenase (short-subunit alcohol dehydrogenase family) [Cognaticolwellia sp.]|jgi:NAD(P)-dependent dehydrogenase (short-subunit alcohol dehydrogenase family)